MGQAKENKGLIGQAGQAQITQIGESLPSHPLTFSPSTFRAGDRVVSNGPHAEVVCVPGNLCARVPDGVTDEEAAFTVLGAIGLKGVRLAAHQGLEDDQICRAVDESRRLPEPLLIC